MRKEDIPLLDRAIDEAVMTAIHEMESPRGMIGGHEQTIDLTRLFSTDSLHPVFVASIITYLGEKKLSAVYDSVAKTILVTINLAVCEMTPKQCRAFNEKFAVAA